MSMMMQKQSRVLTSKRASRRPSVQVLAAKKSSGAMVCVDCGYIYDGSDGTFDSLPSGYKCPVCSSNKKRFFALEGSAPRGSDPKSMQARREKLRTQLKENGEEPEEDTSFLLLTAGSTAVFLGLFALATGAIKF